MDIFAICVVATCPGAAVSPGAAALLSQERWGGATIRITVEIKPAMMAMMRLPPVFFSKPASALVTDGEAVRYPQATSDLHHEVELVVALASGGRDLTLAEAAACVYGYGVGIDFTRRDLQSIAKKHGRPWDTAKGFDQSAPLSALTPKANFAPSTDTPICLTVNDELRHSALLGQMIWSVAEIIEQLSRLFELKAGDIIYTGTPAGVAAVAKGDKLCGEIAGLNALNFDII